jgi:hypothetical protein
VLTITDAVDPERFQRDWMATNTQARLRFDGDLGALNAQLYEGLLAWTQAVTLLRTLDSRPLPVPVKGGRQL